MLSYRKLLSFSLALTAALYIQAQDSTVLENYEVYEVNGNTQLTATIKSGVTCLGINFLRSEDSTLNFQTIGEIQGVCGSSTESIRYDYTDMNPPKNKTLYYKIQMGGLGYSNVLSIRIIDSGEEAYLLTPNPCIDNCLIHFKNELRQSNRLRLFNKNGIQLALLETSDNFFEIDVKELPAAVYFFTVENSETKRSNFEGKITVQK